MARAADICNEGIDSLLESKRSLAASAGQQALNAEESQAYESAHDSLPPSNSSQPCSTSAATQPVLSEAGACFSGEDRENVPPPRQKAAAFKWARKTPASAAQPQAHASTEPDPYEFNGFDRTRSQQAPPQSVQVSSLPFRSVKVRLKVPPCTAVPCLPRIGGLLLCSA